MTTESDNDLFRELTLRDAEESLSEELNKLVNSLPDGSPIQKNHFKKEMQSFRKLFKRYLHNTGGELDWQKISPPPKGMVKAYSSLPPAPSNNIRDMLSQLVVIKLNGGLGTSIGCTGPKSLITVRNNLTFLDLTVQHIERLNATYNIDIPLVLMNSFNTYEETEKVLRKYQQVKVSIYTFMQSMYPRLNRESLLPMPTSVNMEYVCKTGVTTNRSSGANLFNMDTSINLEGDANGSETGGESQPRFECPLMDDVASGITKTVGPATIPQPSGSSPAVSSADQDAWYPPGHGDVYRGFYRSGLADFFSGQNKKWLFISNIDNLGATVNLDILNYLASNTRENDEPEHEFVMEVTDKTRADVKGGTLIDYDGKTRLLEVAQVPKDKIDDFMSVHKFRIFNTNNLWCHMGSMIRQLKENSLHMEVIVNPKTLENGTNVLQLEEASGAAIKCFRGAIGINVPRSRFLPVKTTSDLMLVMSNLYELNAGTLTMSPLRSFPSVPLIKLGSHFRKVKDFLKRVPNVPDLLELDHLTVSGDVWFDKGLTLKGTVIIMANHGELINIPPGATLENKIVSGNLRILDH